MWRFVAPCIIAVMAVLGTISCNKFNVPPPAATHVNATLQELQLQEFIVQRGDLYLPLSPGWLPGRLRDNTDDQWHKLRPFAVPLVLGMFIHTAVGRLISRFTGARHEQATMIWHAVSGFAFCVFLHGPRALWAVGEMFRRCCVLHVTVVACRRRSAQLHDVRCGGQTSAVPRG